ncbi:MAG: hypothetical protein AAF211_09005 [Myxococcota bacterium]
MSEESDRTQLTVVSFLWYATGLLYFGGGLVGALVTLLGWSVTTSMAPETGLLRDGTDVVGGLFECLALGTALWGAVNLYAGYSLSNLRNQTFISLAAVANLVFFPIGTVLGIFTLVVLGRPGMHRRFRSY